MLDVDYSKYLSVDNGRGLLLSQDDISVLSKYGFDYRNYTDLGSLIFDVDNYVSYNLDYDDDLEIVLMRLSEKYYYNNVKK